MTSIIFTPDFPYLKIRKLKNTSFNKRGCQECGRKLPNHTTRAFRFCKPQCKWRFNYVKRMPYYRSYYIGRIKNRQTKNVKRVAKKIRL